MTTSAVIKMYSCSCYCVRSTYKFRANQRKEANNDIRIWMNVGCLNETRSFNSFHHLLRLQFHPILRTGVCGFVRSIALPSAPLTVINLAIRVEHHIVFSSIAKRQPLDVCSCCTYMWVWVCVFVQRILIFYSYIYAHICNHTHTRTHICICITRSRLILIVALYNLFSMLSVAKVVIVVITIAIVVGFGLSGNFLLNILNKS